MSHSDTNSLQMLFMRRSRGIPCFSSSEGSRFSKYVFPDKKMSSKLTKSYDDKVSYDLNNHPSIEFVDCTSGSSSTVAPIVPIHTMSFNFCWSLLIYFFSDSTVVIYGIVHLIYVPDQFKYLPLSTIPPCMRYEKKFLNRQLIALFTPHALIMISPN